MFIDAGIIGLVVVFCLIGLKVGFWSQLLRILVLGSLYFIAPPVARMIRDPLAGWLESSRHTEGVDIPLSETGMDGVALIAAAIGLYMAFSLVIGIALLLMGKKKKSATNKFLGLVLGGMKGGALAYLLLCGLVLVVRSELKTQLDSDVIAQAEASMLVGVVEDYNALEEMGYRLPTESELETLILEYQQQVTDAREKGDEDATAEPAEGEGDESEPASLPAEQNPKSEPPLERIR